MKTRILSASIGLLGLATNCAHANSVSFDLAYETAGQWTISGSSMWGDSCIAEISNNQSTLRIMYTVYTNSWHFGVPYYQNNNPTAKFGLGWPNVATQPIQMSTQVLDGWAMYDFSENFNIIQNAQDGWFLNINLDRGLQSWQLHNKSAILVKIKQCAQNHGKRAAAQVDQKKLAAFFANLKQKQQQQAAPAKPQFNFDKQKFAAALKAHQQKKQQQAAPAKPQFKFDQQKFAAALKAQQQKRTAAPKQPAFSFFDQNGCPKPGTFQSQSSNKPINVEFRDWTHQQQAKSIFWIDYKGQLVRMPDFVNGNARFRAYDGHNFVVKDFNGKCYGGLHKVSANKYIFDIK